MGITRGKISNGTYDQSGKIYFEFYLEDDPFGTIISGNFSGEFYYPTYKNEADWRGDNYCAVNGIATGIVEDDLRDPDKDETYKVQTSFTTNVITSSQE